jgi:hypothetical protein
LRCLVNAGGRNHIVDDRPVNFVLGQNNEQASLQAKRSKQKQAGRLNLKTG